MQLQFVIFKTFLALHFTNGILHVNGEWGRPIVQSAAVYINTSLHVLCFELYATSQFMKSTYIEVERKIFYTCWCPKLANRHRKCFDLNIWNNLNKENIIKVPKLPRRT